MIFIYTYYYNQLKRSTMWHQKKLFEICINNPITFKSNPMLTTNNYYASVPIEIPIDYVSRLQTKKNVSKKSFAGR